MTTREDDRGSYGLTMPLCCAGHSDFYTAGCPYSNYPLLALYIPIILLILRYSLTKNLIWRTTSFEWKFLAFLQLQLLFNYLGDQRQSLKEIWGELITPIILFIRYIFQ